MGGISGWGDGFYQFHYFLTAPRRPENGPTVVSSSESRIRAAGKMVENGDKWSKNGGACISWCAQDQATGVMTRWCSSKTTNHRRRRNWRIDTQDTPHLLHPSILVIRTSARASR